MSAKERIVPISLTYKVVIKYQVTWNFFKCHIVYFLIFQVLKYKAFKISPLARRFQNQKL